MPTSEPDCPFCEIVAREDADAREVYRDAHSVAFFPTEPATLGHTLVVPRTHCPDIWSLEPELGAHLAVTVINLAAAVKRAMRPDGLNIIQSNGAAATQTVMHIHVHIVPRWIGDPVGRIWPPETDYTEDAKDAAWARLRDEARLISRSTRTG